MDRKKIIASTVCIAVWIGLCAFNFLQDSMTSKLQTQNEDAKKLCEELENEFLVYEEQNQKIPQGLEEYEHWKEETALKIELYGDVEQAFHGRWSVYTANEF